MKVSIAVRTATTQPPLSSNIAVASMIAAGMEINTAIRSTTAVPARALPMPPMASVFTMLGNCWEVVKKCHVM